MTRTRIAFGAFLAAFVLTRLVQLPQPLGVDEGIFATAGWGLTRGLMLYRDVWDQKPPGVHLTYAAGFALFGARDGTVLLLDAIASAIACALVFAIARRLRSVRAAWAAVIAFAIGTYPAFALPYGGFLERAVPETFITTLAAAAVWCALRSQFALAGLAVGVAVIFKPTALIYWALVAMCGARGAGRGAERAEHAEGFARASVVSAAALLVPIAITVLWLQANGALTDAKIAVLDYNRAYVVAGSSWLAMPNILAHEIWRLVKTDPLWCAAGFAGIAWIVGRVFRPAASGAGSKDPAYDTLVIVSVAWLAAAVIAVAANGVRMYATYFLPTAPPLALLVGSLFAGGSKDPPYDARKPPYDARNARARVDAGRVFRPGARNLVSAAAVLLAGIVAARSHYPDRLVRYTAADLAQLRGTAPRAPYLDGSAQRAAYLEMFGGYANGRGYSARANDELAAYLRAHTTDGDRVYIFGMAPAVYFDAHRLPANRFVWTFPAVAPFAGHPAFTVDALAADLQRAAPAYVVLERNNRDSSTGWRIDDVYAAAAIRRVLDGYVREIQIEDFTVMRLALK